MQGECDAQVLSDQVVRFQQEQKYWKQALMAMLILFREQIEHDFSQLSLSSMNIIQGVLSM